MKLNFSAKQLGRMSSKTMKEHVDNSLKDFEENQKAGAEFERDLKEAIKLSH